jgi:hypothetical protein
MTNSALEKVAWRADRAEAERCSIGLPAFGPTTRRVEAHRDLRDGGRERSYRIVAQAFGGLIVIKKMADGDGEH